MAGFLNFLPVLQPSPPSRESFPPQVGLQPTLSSAVIAASPAEPVKKWDSRSRYLIPHDTAYYLKCAASGSLACGLTHVAITPLDVTKCNMQVNPTKYKVLVRSMATIVREQGASALTKGWAPTLLGYSAQGMFKYGLYEYFKDFYSNLAGEETSNMWRYWIFLASSASAEVVADVALCPMEMVKVKMQIAGTFPTTLGPALAKMSELRAETKFPFGSLGPLWSRQIPYTMAKFLIFERTVKFFYDNIFTQPKETYSNSTRLSITFAGGFTAGVVCAIISHPADTLVALRGKTEHAGKTVRAIAAEVGYGRVATRGLGARVLMVGCMTAVQW